jgi:hypothetical protein
VNEPHQARQVAESFGSDAERYDRARPRYPAAMVEAIVAASPGPRGSYLRRLQPAPAGQAAGTACGYRRRHRRGGSNFTLGYTAVVATAARSGAT